MKTIIKPKRKRHIKELELYTLKLSQCPRQYNLQRWLCTSLLFVQECILYTLRLIGPQKMGPFSVTGIFEPAPYLRKFLWLTSFKTLLSLGSSSSSLFLSSASSSTWRHFWNTMWTEAGTSASPSLGASWKSLEKIQPRTNFRFCHPCAPHHRTSSGPDQ